MSSDPATPETTPSPTTPAAAPTPLPNAAPPASPKTFFPHEEAEPSAATATPDSSSTPAPKPAPKSASPAPQNTPPSASPKTFIPDEEHLPSAESQELGALDRRPRVLSATSPAVPGAAEKTGTDAVHKRTWRSLFAEGLTPKEVGIACGLGVAIGISPLPGLHYALALGCAWLLRLNMPLVLLAANISFGPLLVIWYALGIAIGREMLLGEPLMHSWPILRSHLAEAKDLHGLLLLLSNYFWPWFLGSTLLMVVCGPIFGFLAFVVAKSVKRGKDSLTRRFHKH